MTDETILEIRGGRHLLHEFAVTQYISNDTLLEGGNDGKYSSMVSTMGICRLIADDRDGSEWFRQISVWEAGGTCGRIS